MTTQIDSTSFQRVAADVMRHQYRELDDFEKADMYWVKNLGTEFHRYIEDRLENEDLPYDRRCTALAKTKIEEAVMWAVKAITK